MNRTMPVIHESTDDLRHRLQQERDHRKRQRLHYLLATGQAAQLLGVERNTVSRSLTQYTQGGWTRCWRSTSRRAKPRLGSAHLTHLQQRLAQPTDFTS